MLVPRIVGLKNRIFFVVVTSRTSFMLGGFACVEGAILIAV